jgi:hypothetical protein
MPQSHDDDDVLNRPITDENPGTYHALSLHP